MTSTQSPPTPAPRHVPHRLGVLALVRPRQWAKNLLVVAAPLAAGALSQPAVARATAVAFVAFTLAASGTYALNDVADRVADARHPTKRDRPVASGAISPSRATTIGVVLLLASLALPLGVGMAGLAALIATYLVLTTAYSQWLKHVALFDVAIVTAGFLLRAMGGAVAAGLPMSRWFLIVVAFGSLYVVANKRAAEHRRGGGDGQTRAALVGYTTELLREIRFTAGAVTVAGYVSWAFEQHGGAIGNIGRDPWAALTIAPFVLGVFRYAAAVEAGLGEAPEDILLRDRVLQGLGLVWLGLFAVAVYAG